MAGLLSVYLVVKSLNTALEYNEYIERIKHEIAANSSILHWIVAICFLWPS